MAKYLFGSPIGALVVTVMLACAIGLASSMIFTWASDKSALWNMGFAILLLAAATLALLLVVFLLRFA